MSSVGSLVSRPVGIRFLLHEVTVNVLLNVFFYITQDPVHWTAQSALHFLTSMTDLFIPTPTRLLLEHSSHAAITCND